MKFLKSKPTIFYKITTENDENDKRLRENSVFIKVKMKRS